MASGQSEEEQSQWELIIKTSELPKGWGSV